MSEAFLSNLEISLVAPFPHILKGTFSANITIASYGRTVTPRMRAEVWANDIGDIGETSCTFWVPALYDYE